MQISKSHLEVLGHPGTFHLLFFPVLFIMYYSVGILFFCIAYW